MTSTASVNMLLKLTVFSFFNTDKWTAWDTLYLLMTSYLLWTDLFANADMLPEKTETDSSSSSVSVDKNIASYTDEEIAVLMELMS